MFQKTRSVFWLFNVYRFLVRRLIRVVAIQSRSRVLKIDIYVHPGVADGQNWLLKGLVPEIVQLANCALPNIVGHP